MPSSTWLFVALAAALAACGTEDDQRPPTLEVITLTVLAPSCGQVQCHSTSTKTRNLAFDTVEASRTSLRDELSIDKRKPLENDLMDALNATGKSRMPPDSPLPDEDIALIATWLQNGAPGI